MGVRKKEIMMENTRPFLAFKNEVFDLLRKQYEKNKTRPRTLKIPQSYETLVLDGDRNDFGDELLAKVTLDGIAALPRMWGMQVIWTDQDALSVE